MENSTVKVRAYEVLMHRYKKPSLDIFEITVLRYLRQGKSKEFIQQKLCIPIKYVIVNLLEKGILKENGSFFYKNLDEWYILAEKILVKAIIFFDIEEGQFFNCWIYPHELRVDKDLLLATSLGCSYTSEYTALHVLNTHTFNYVKPNRANPPTTYLRRLTDCAFDYIDYVLISI